jgi:hypothetical protein
MRSKYPTITVRRTSRRLPVLRLGLEAVANWVTRPLLTGGLAVLLSAALLSVTVAESNAVTDVRRYEDELVATGFATLFVQASGQALSGLTTDDCAAVGELPGVRAGFSLVGQSVARRWTVDGPLLATITVTGDVVGYLRLVEPARMRESVAAQAFVDTDAAAASSGAQGEYVLRLVATDADNEPPPSAATALGDPPSSPMAATVRAVRVPLTSLGTGSVGSTLLVTHARGAVQSCVLFVDLEARAAVAAAVETALPAASGFSNQWALPGADNLDTPRERFEQRPSQYYWLAAVIVFTVLWAFQLRIRRSDHALYAVVGLRSTGITVMIVLELAITVVVAAGSAALIVALATTTRSGTYDSLGIGIDSAQRALIGSAVCAAAWSWQHAQRTTASALNALKDR